MLDDSFHPEDAYHYRVIRRAIDILDGADHPLSLSELASALRMSPAHFQRVFSRWAGVSPKRYQQYLLHGPARDLLARRMTTLDVSNALGLSGSGRLHDLFLTWEAMSPGEAARGGAGLTVAYGRFDGPFGTMLAMGTDRGLCGLALTAEVGDAAAFADLSTRWPRASYVEDPAAVAPWVEAALGRHGQTRLHLMGGPFQVKVWEALLAVPSGHVTTYSDLAVAIGHSTAVRAVGTAVGRNPVSWLIPCHRVLRKTGALGGYHWGLPLKRAMLARESAALDAGE